MFFFHPFKNRNHNKNYKSIFRFVKKLANIAFYFIFKFFNLRLLPIPLEALGHQIFDLECFFYEYKKKKLNFKPIIVDLKFYIANRYFFYNYQKKKNNFLIIKNKILGLLLIAQRNCKNVTYNTYDYQQTHKVAKEFTIFNKKPFKYKLDKKDELLAKGIIKKYNININKNFILMHVRDNNFKPFDGEDYRSSNVNDFSLAVKWLKEKNFQIIRMGHYNMNKFSIKKEIIDLTTIKFLQEEREILELYFIQNCYFFIGTASGPYCLASAFDKPLVTFDTAPLSNVFPCARRGISVPKLYTDKNNKILSFDEVVNYNFTNYRLSIDYIKNNIKLRNTSKIEILETIKELYLRVKKDDFTEKKLQKDFKKLFNRKLHYSANSKSSISYVFIKKYKNLLSHNI
jgi:putative glycosyltransferase (TIGR04372 family)